MPSQFFDRRRSIVLISLCIAGAIVIGFGPEIFRAMSGVERMVLPTSNEIRADDTIRSVWNSGVWADPDTSRHIFWVDDTTLLFKANKDPKPRTIDEARARVEWLYLWRLGEKPQPHGADPKEAAVGYCAARGNVSYFQHVLDSSTGNKIRPARWLGPPGKEVEVPLRNVPSSHASTRPVNNPQLIPPIECEPFVDPAMIGFSYATDPDRKFYVVLGVSPNPHKPELREQLVLMRANGMNRVVLPIFRTDKVVQYDISSQTFLVYQNILFDGDLGPSPNDFDEWRKSDCLPIWRVKPETAEVEKVCIPYGPWVGEPPRDKRAGAIFELVPTKAGLFFHIGGPWEYPASTGLRTEMCVMF